MLARLTPLRYFHTVTGILFVERVKCLSFHTFGIILRTAVVSRCTYIFLCKRTVRKAALFLCLFAAPEGCLFSLCLEPPYILERTRVYRLFLNAPHLCGTRCSNKFYISPCGCFRLCFFFLFSHFTTLLSVSLLPDGIWCRSMRFAILERTLCHGAQTVASRVWSDLFKGHQSVRTGHLADWTLSLIIFSKFILFIYIPRPTSHTSGQPFIGCLAIWHSPLIHPTGLYRCHSINGCQSPNSGWAGLVILE